MVHGAAHEGQLFRARRGVGKGRGGIMKDKLRILETMELCRKYMQIETRSPMIESSAF